MELLAWELRQPDFLTWEVGNCNHSVPPGYSFDDMKDMPFTTLQSAQITRTGKTVIISFSSYHSAICEDGSVVKGIILLGDARAISRTVAIPSPGRTATHRKPCLFFSPT